MRRFRHAFWTLLLGVLPLFAQAPKLDDAALSAFHGIASQELYAWVDTLASDAFDGRLTGTPGYDASARWLARYLAAWGVAPLGDDGTYFQSFDLAYTEVSPDHFVRLHLPSGQGEVVKSYRYWDEYFPGATSGSGEVKAPVVYVGYGITAPELGYDEYAGLDVKGKIVLVEREVPVNPDKDPKRFKAWRPYSFHQYKLENAVRHGAAGMLYNYGPIVNPNNAYAEGFVYAHVGRAVVADLFAGTGRDHAEALRRIAKERKPQSFKTGKTVSLRMTTTHHPDGRGHNVLGMIPGSDPALKDEVILLGGHLDHLGRCHELIPGANDNASAVAVIMAVAKALKTSGIPLKRSVGLAFFGAEEQALLGSDFFLKHPPVPLQNTLCLLNLDGVGAGDRLFALAGENFPALWAYVDSANARYVHRPLETNYFFNRARPRLDAARFLWAGVPSLSFSASGRDSHYHTPGDDLSVIDAETLEDLAKILFVAVLDMANTDARLQFRVKPMPPSHKGE